MQRVGAGPRRDRHGSGGMLAGLGAHRTGLNLEFLKGIRERKRLVQSVEGIVRSSAIQSEGDLVGIAAGDRDRDRGKVLVAVQIVGNRALRGGVTREQDQLSRLARVQWQFHDLLVIDHLPDSAGVGFHSHRLGLNGHLFVHRADFKRGVDGRVRIHVEYDAQLDVGRETRLGDFHPVGADYEGGEQVGAIGAADHGTGLAGVGVNDLHLCATNGGA